MTGKDNRLLAIIGTMVGLRSLALPHVEVTTAAMAHLASLPHLEHLSSTLEMAVGGLCAAPPDDVRVASPAVRSAQQPPGSPSPLWHLRCEAAALPYLQGLPHLRSLTLNVRGCRNINSAQFALLATMPGVTTLQLHGCLTYPRMPATAEVCAAIGRAVSVRELLLRGSFHVDLEGLGILLGGLTALVPTKPRC